MGWSMSSCLLKIRSLFINWFVGDSALVVRWLLDDFDALPTVRSILKIIQRNSRGSNQIQKLARFH